MSSPSRRYRRRNELRCTAAHAESLEPRCLLAGDLLLDINPGPASSDPSPLVEAGEVFYFTADDGTHGRELWHTDGTAAGTVLVADIIPGPAGSSPFALTEFNDELYFLIDDGGANVALWKTRGAGANTVRVIDLSADPDRSAPRQLTDSGDHLYFTRAYRGLPDAELWKSDGTEAGTSLLKSYYNGTDAWPANASGVANLTDVIGTLFYTATRVSPIDGTELWATDGAVVHDLDINPSGTSLPSSLVASNVHLLLSATDGGSTLDLYRVDSRNLQSTLLRAGTHTDDIVGDQGVIAFFTDRTTPLDADPSLWALWLTTTGADVHEIVLPDDVRLQRDPLHKHAPYAFFVVTDPLLGDVLYRAASTSGTSRTFAAAPALDLQDTSDGEHLMLSDLHRLFFVNGERITSIESSFFSRREIADIPPGATVGSMARVRNTLVYSLDDDAAAAAGNELWVAQAYAPTTTTITSSAPVTGWNEPVTFTVTARPLTPDDATPNYGVSFYEGNRWLHSAPFVNGVATWTTALLSPGVHHIRAEFNGDENFYASASAPFTQRITGTPITVAAVMASPVVPVGKWVAVQVHVADGITGQSVSFPARVTLRDGDVVLAETVLSYIGAATLQYKTTAIGSRTFTVHVDAEREYEAGTSNPVAVTAVQATVSASFSMHYRGTQYGNLLGAQAIFDTNNSEFLNVGTIQIRDAVTGEVFASSNGVRLWELSFLLPPGQRQIRAEFLGTDTHAPAVSEPITVTIQPTATRVELNVLERHGTELPPLLEAFVNRMPDENAPGSPVPLGGRVFFKMDGDVIAKVDSVNGFASYQVPDEFVGRIATFSAYYKGDGVGFLPSTAPKAQTDMRRFSDARWATTGVVGQQGRASRLEVSVRGWMQDPVSGGSVQFFTTGKHPQLVASAPVVDGRAVANLKLPPGFYDLSATFVGGPTHRPVSVPGVAEIWVHHATRVDLMIAYTEEALTSVAGITKLKTIALDAVEQMNRALYNSRIAFTVRLVRLVEVDYQETGNYHTELKRLATKGDGYMDTLHSQRNKYGADLVSLFVGLEGADATIGLAYRMASASAKEAPFGFSVVKASEANQSGYTLAHELGHNFGASHDTSNSPAGNSPIAPYAHGHRFWVNITPFRDLMSYPPGKAILHFANPRVSYKGTPTGDARTADLARLFATTAPIVARYRDARVMFGDETI